MSAAVRVIVGGCLATVGGVSSACLLPPGQPDDNAGGEGGSGGGGMGGSGKLNNGVGENTPVTGCSDSNDTVGKIEKNLILPKCGEGSLCHITNGTFQPDLETPGAHARLVDTPITFGASHCKGQAYIDSSVDVMESFFVQKFNSPTPKCPDGMPGGDPMPFNMPQLSQEEKDCLIAYVKVIAVMPN